MVDEKLEVLSPRPEKNGSCEAQNCECLERHGALSTNCFESPLSESQSSIEAMMEARKSD